MVLTLWQQPLHRSCNLHGKTSDSVRLRRGPGKAVHGHINERMNRSNLAPKNSSSCLIFVFTILNSSLSFWLAVSFPWLASTKAHNHSIFHVICNNKPVWIEITLVCFREHTYWDSGSSSPGFIVNCHCACTCIIKIQGILCLEPYGNRRKRGSNFLA